jgi:hypothetical protein
VGTTFQGKYSDSIKAAYVYPSSNFLDDLTWAACWLYRKTGEQQFVQARTRPMWHLSHTRLIWQLHVQIYSH